MDVVAYILLIAVIAVLAYRLHSLRQGIKEIVYSMKQKNICLQEENVKALGAGLDELYEEVIYLLNGEDVRHSSHH